MTHQVQFYPSGTTIAVPFGALVSDAAKQAGVWIDSPCGGKGTCKKCVVFLSQDGRTESVLACQTRITADCSITRSNQEFVRPLSEGIVRNVPYAPYPGATAFSERSCFAAFDLGTTTIVCYLLDAKTGEQIAAVGIQNPQSAYGADVITRANYVLTSERPNVMQQYAVEALNQLLRQVLDTCNRELNDLSLVTLVGNTVMLHLLLGYPLQHLVCSPYQPYRTERRILPANQIGLTAQCPLLIAPVIGGFVGADTVACMSATEFGVKRNPTLLIDVGTNGEIVLTDGKRILCCSTAAGPAFEGANISCGMRAVTGAIDRVWLDNQQLCYSVIGNGDPLGLCGSGLIDLCALLFRQSIIDEGGRFQESTPLGERIFTMTNGMKAFLVSQEEHPIVLTQKDIRELQLGKAAIRAGIETLLHEFRLASKQIHETLLAGAFGNYLSAQSLCDIGLLPRSLIGSIRSVGNAAGEGAKLYARNFALFEESETMAKKTNYIELALSPVFTEYYMDAMAFPCEED
ncbi:MAG: ASKHA domain-containing protein [Eubacteriales bacterium]|nr:ASKHA domain-containing protein [Eubacteriales bacterium]